MYDIFKKKTFEPKHQMLNIKSDVLHDKFKIGSTQHNFPETTLAHIRETVYPDSKYPAIEYNEFQSDWATAPGLRPGASFDRELNAIRKEVANNFSLNDKPLNIDNLINK